jgi:hypothetical protein
MIVYEVVMRQDERRIRHGWVKTLDEATTYMDTFIAGATGTPSYRLDVIKHKAQDSRTEAVLAILNGDTEQTIMYSATLIAGKAIKVWRKNRKILSPQRVIDTEVIRTDNHPSSQHAEAVEYVMRYSDLLTLCVKAPTIAAWQETTRRISLREGALSTRRMRSYVWHWFHTGGKLSP